MLKMDFDYWVVIMHNMDFVIDCINKDLQVFVEDNLNNHDFVIEVLDCNFMAFRLHFLKLIVKIYIFFPYNRISINKMRYKSLLWL